MAPSGLSIFATEPDKIDAVLDDGAAALDGAVGGGAPVDLEIRIMTDKSSGDARCDSKGLRINDRKASTEPNRITYTGWGDPVLSADAIEAASARLGMACRREWLGERGFLIEAEQRSSWPRVILRSLPQRVSWRVALRDERLTLTADFRLFRWYATLLGGLLVMTLSGLSASLLTALGKWQPEPEWLERTLLALYFPTGLLALAMVRFIGPLGGGATVEALWQSVLAPLQREGNVLEPQGLGHTRRYGRLAFGYFVVLLLIAAGVYLIEPQLIWRFFPNGPLIVTFALAAVGLCLFAALLLNPARRSFLLRSDPALPGLLSLIFMATLPLPSLPWQALASEVSADGDEYFLPVEESLIRVRNVPPEVQSEIDRPVRDARRSQARMLVWMTFLLAVPPILIGMSAVSTTIHTRLALERLRSHRTTDGIYRQVLADISHLRRFRMVFVTVWILLFLLLMSALGYLFLCAIQAAAPTFTPLVLRLPELSASALVTLLGRPHGDPWIYLPIRGLWLLYGSTGLGLLLASAGHLLLARRAERRKLRKASEGGETGSRQRALRAMVSALALRAGVAEVKLAVLPDPRPDIAAQCFGLGGRERFIVVTEGALEDFDDEELTAIFAHELVHLRQGHGLKMTLLRWLGRLTFSGDGFALSLQNSFGYEQEADRFLLADSLATAEGLERALIKMRHIAPAWQGFGLLRFAWIASRGERPRRDFGLREDEKRILVEGPLALPLVRRWRLAWWLFRHQYLTAMELHYWHPSYEERLSEVRQMRNAPGAGNGR